jgi:hypothetical protein
VSFNGRIDYYVGTGCDDDDDDDDDEDDTRRRHGRLLRSSPETKDPATVHTHKNAASSRNMDGVSFSSSEVLPLPSSSLLRHGVPVHRGDEDEYEYDHDRIRNLDHQHIDEWNGGLNGARDPADLSSLTPDDQNTPVWDVFRLWTSPWFVRYRGGLTMPQCYDETRVSQVKY